MNKEMNFTCIANVPFSSTSTWAALLVDHDLKSIYSLSKCLFTQSFINHKYLLSTYYMPNTVVGTQNTSVDNTEKKAYSHETIF